MIALVCRWRRRIRCCRHRSRSSWRWSSCCCLTVVIAKFVVPRFEATYAERTAAIQGGIEKAEKAQEAAEAALQEYNDQLAEARTEAARIREDAKTQGTQILAELREQAQAEAARIKASGRGSARVRAHPGADPAPQRDRWPGHHAGQPDRRGVAGGRRTGPADGRPLHRQPRVVGGHTICGPLVRGGASDHQPTRRGGSLMSVGSDARVQALDDVLDAAQRESTADSGIVGRIVGAVRGAPSESDLRQLSADLFAVVDALSSSASLRRAVTDPGRPERERQRLVHELLDGKVSKTAVDIVAEGAAMRWAGGRPLPRPSIDRRVRAQLMVAERDGTLEEAEDELFRFARLVESDPELRNALGDRSVGLAHRQELVGELLAGRATRHYGRAGEAGGGGPRADLRPHHRGFRHPGGGPEAPGRGHRSGGPAADHRAAGTVCGPPSASRSGREVAIQEVIDPDVLGGVQVELGDELIEGTVKARLDEARRLFG